MELIDYDKAIRYINYEAAHRMYAPIMFANKMMESKDVVDATLDFVDDLLTKWQERYKRGHTLIPDKELREFAKGISLVEELNLNPYETEEQVGFWVSYCIGLRVMAMPVEDALPLVRHLYFSFDGRGFVYSYHISKEMASAIQKTTDLTPENLLLPRMVRSEEDARSYMQQIRQTPFEKQMELVMKEYYYHDFNPLPDVCYLLSVALLESEMYKEWMDCLLKIEILPLQAEFMNRIRKTDDWKAILLELSSRGNETKVVQMLLMNSWIHFLIRSKEQKLPNKKDETTDMAFSSAWQASVEWQENKIKENVDKLLPEFVSVIGAELTSELVFGKTTREGKNAYLTAERYIVKLLQEAVANTIDVAHLSVKSADINYLSFLARQYVEKGVGMDKCLLLMDEILNLVESEEFRWIPSLNENNQKMLRSIAGLFVKILDENGNLGNLIGRFKVRYEGINAHWMNVWSERASKEVLILCALFLTAESDDWREDKKERVFEIAANHLLMQGHCCGLDIIVEQDYQTALIVAMAIADQILSSIRDRFAIAAWESIYEKYVALSALAMVQQPLPDVLKDQIRTYRDIDWQVKKQEMLHRTMKGQVENIETLFLKLI